MGQQDPVELESFLPKYTPDAPNNGDYPMPTEGSAPPSERVRRTKVKFFTGSSEVIQRGVFVFGDNFTVKQAAEYAVARYPEVENMPDFTDIYVFLSDDFPVLDVDANVHSVFGPDDEMIITNDSQVFKKKLHAEAMCALSSFCIIIICFIAFFCWLVKR